MIDTFIGEMTKKSLGATSLAMLTENAPSPNTSPLAPPPNATNTRPMATQHSAAPPATTPVLYVPNPTPQRITPMRLQTAEQDTHATTRRSAAVTNLAQQAPWHRCQCHSHPCLPVVRPCFHCCNRGYPPGLDASTDLRHITPVAIVSPTTGRSRPLSFVSVMLLAHSSPVIVTNVISCLLYLCVLSPVRYVCCLTLIKLCILLL